MSNEKTNNVSNENSNEETFYLMIPNKYVRCNVSTKYGLSKKFYMVYLLIDMNRTLNDRSIIVSNHIIRFYRYTSARSKVKCFAEIKEVLEYMVKEGMITLFTDLSKIHRYDSAIEMDINVSKFYDDFNVSYITIDELRKIASINISNVNTETLLMFYLYVRSYIVERDDNIEPSEYYKYPEIFFCPLDKISNDLNMSQKTVIKYLKILTLSNEPLLVRKTLTPITFDNGTKLILPNLYALNKSGYEKELEWGSEMIIRILKNKKISFR